MRPIDIARLIALSAIWGGSFIFMRVLAPVFGPALTAALRVLIAGAALTVYFRILRFDIHWRRFWKQYLVIGAFNSAIPFLCFAFAALYIPASLSVILNSLSPFFAALFSAFWLAERLTVRRIAGIILGAVGVSLVVGLGNLHHGYFVVASIAACIVATICYGFSSTYAKKFNGGAEPRGIAAASQMFAGILLMPIVPLSPARAEVTAALIGLMVVYSLLCNTIGYLFYYRLIADLGPTRALTVTFLMPVFGMLWGSLILNEQITWPMIAGTAIILAGTAMVLQSGQAKPAEAVVLETKSVTRDA